uniref:Chemokine interleukin-8-like domain-containing protein n=1 Tax=Kryptolebias marmoratus TaxID=37003 RepID=A0A3Q3BS02_KRYMA
VFSLGLLFLLICYLVVFMFRLILNRPCCVEVTMRNLTSRVVGNQYYQQRRRSYCVEALIFNTNEGQVCVNPQASWAKLRKLSQQKHVKYDII